MADSVSSVRRSEIMSHIKSKDTSIELLVRRKLFSMGYRYRVNYKALPGKPDIVFTRKKIAIFIHGCYWHGHDCGSHYAHASQSNKAYWGPKIERTKQRDQEHIQALETDGWKVIVLWECEIRSHFESTIFRLEQLTEASDPKEVLVKSLFEDSYNYMKSGTLMRSVINKLNEIDFDKASDRHLFNDIYENILKDLQSAGNSGEYYTPRPVTQFMVDMVNPQLGEQVLDFACGTGGFLVCALEHLRKQVHNIDDEAQLQNSILGVEKKPLPHMLCTTNLILHNIDNPQIKHDNSLGYPVKDIKPKDKVGIILTNPPFGGIEEDGIEDNFPANYKTKETADLFLVLLMYKLNQTGRAAIVLPDGFLFGEGVKTVIKEKLLSEFRPCLKNKSCTINQAMRS